MNKVILKGHLGAKPELRYTQNGSPVCNYRLATTERFKNAAGDQQESTEWHKCVIFGNRGEAFSNYMDKGSEVLCTGRIQTRTWEDQDGVTRYSTEIVVDNFEFCGGKGKGNGNRQDDKQSTSGKTNSSNRNKPAPDYQQQSMFNQRKRPPNDDGGEFEPDFNDYNDFDIDVNNDEYPF